eukprot:1146441-Pelagomonas_calceolata.AAC.1
MVGAQHPMACARTSLVAHEASQVGRLGGVVVLGEGLNLALSAAATLPGAEAQGTASRVCEGERSAATRLLVHAAGGEFWLARCLQTTALLMHR